MTADAQTIHGTPRVGVFVLGMHRSGTSMTTRLLNMLGVPLCHPSDLLGRVRGNEKGLWESGTLVRFNDALLRERKATWWCPPRPNNEWIRLPLTADRLEPARNAFCAVHPSSQWLWKDPRTCLTLPFWLRALNFSPVMVVVTRHPFEIAASLRERDRFHPALSVALWERYMHHLLPNLAGMPTLLTPYERILSDTPDWCDTVSQFLGAHGLELNERTQRGALRHFADTSLRHHQFTQIDIGVQLSPQQLALFDWLNTRIGISSAFDPSGCPHETPATDRIFTQIQHRYRLRASTSDAARIFATPKGSPEINRKRPVRPPATAVVISRNEGPMLRRTVRRLFATLPSKAEIIVVDDASTDSSYRPLQKQHERIRVIHLTRRIGIAGARNLGAHESRGDIIVWSDAHINPRQGWFAPLATAVAAPDVGAVGPALSPFFRPKVRVYGLAFADEALNVHWLPRQAHTPYPVPLLPGCFLAMRREVAHIVGGFDHGMIGYGAEDLEMCLRLWKRGLECLIVPRAVVAHRFRAHPKAALEWELFMLNLLRLGTLHLGRENLTRFLEVLRSHDKFDRAFARVTASDAFLRRSALTRESRFDDDWFFQRFEHNLFSVRQHTTNAISD